MVPHPTPRPADILQENFCKQKDVKVYKEEKTSRIFKQQIVMMEKEPYYIAFILTINS